MANSPTSGGSPRNRDGRLVVSKFRRRHRAPISHIQGLGIFGQFDYNIDFQDKEVNPKSGRLAIIYGDNGVGKTTFLRAVHFLLSPAAHHKIELASVPIESLTVQYSSGAQVSMRQSLESPGSITIEVMMPGEDLFKADVQSRSEGSRDVFGRDEGSFPGARELTSRLKAVSRPPIFVADDRSVECDEFNDAPTAAELRSYNAREALAREVLGPRGSALLLSRVRVQELRSAIARAEQSLSRDAVFVMSSGQSGSSSVYRDMIRHINKPAVDLDSENIKEELLHRINLIQNRAPAFEKYGLVSFQQLEDVRKELSKLRRNAKQLPVVAQILDPFLKSLDAQMASLEDVRNRIDTYVTSVNTFLRRKHFSYEIAAGTSLSSANEDELALESLSSGEKHLLLLLSYAIVAWKTGGLFIIDEPELSLGIDWKRSLLRELLRCTAGAEVQFLIASHSVEVMSPYRERLAHPVER